MNVWNNSWYPVMGSLTAGWSQNAKTTLLVVNAMIVAFVAGAIFGIAASGH